MRKFVITIGLCGILSACATGPTAFGPSTSDSRMGFQNTQIENDRFRVQYTARSDKDAHNYALLRAAQITLEQNFTHFKIINGGVTDNGPRSPVSTSIGIGTGRYYGRSHSNLGVGINVLDLARAFQGDKVTRSIEVRLLNASESGPDIYDAQNIVSTIKPEVFKS